MRTGRTSSENFSVNNGQCINLINHNMIPLAQLTHFTPRNLRSPPGMNRAENRYGPDDPVTSCPSWSRCRPGSALAMARTGLPYGQVSQPGSFTQPEFMDFGTVPGFPDIRQPTRSGSSNRAVGCLEGTEK